MPAGPFTCWFWQRIRLFYVAPPSALRVRRSLSKLVLVVDDRCCFRLFPLRVCRWPGLPACWSASCCMLVNRSSPATRPWVSPLPRIRATPAPVIPAVSLAVASLPVLPPPHLTTADWTSFGCIVVVLCSEVGGARRGRGGGVRGGRRGGSSPKHSPTGSSGVTASLARAWFWLWLCACVCVIVRVRVRVHYCACVRRVCACANVVRALCACFA